jgi:DNA (cytosine-5)-methyltransferase 1
MATQQPTVIDLFCGAGGLSEGFRQAGFRVLVGQDIDLVAGATFSATHPHATFVGGPIQDVSVTNLLNAARRQRGEIDVIVGGPPCQGYSVYNHQRGEHDPRAGLFKEYLRIVDGVMPRWIVMENVTGITSIADGNLVQAINAGLSELGYRVEMKVLRAEEYGVPQERRRVFFLGTRTNAEICFPVPTHGPDLRPFVTVGDAISDLPPLRNGDKAEPSACQMLPQNDYQRSLRGHGTPLFNHRAGQLSKVNQLRMHHVPPGGSWRDIPTELLPDGMKKAKRSDHTKRYGRPRMTDLACTILTKCDVHWVLIFTPRRIGRSLFARRLDYSLSRIISTFLAAERTSMFKLGMRYRRY